MRRGTSFIAGPPTGSPSPGFVTTPTPSPRSSEIPGSSFQETRTVRRAPCVTSGSSPASLTTTASAQPSPTSHRSTSKETRRLSPFPGSLTSTLPCGSPVMRAVAAALAAAAAQVPVVQPVLSFSSLARAMLGGMAGSRSFRSGGIFPLLRPAEHVRELRAVEVRTGTTRREARADQDQGLPGKSCFPDAVGQLLKRTLDDQLVRPARFVDDRARGIRRVAAFQERLLQGGRAGGREEDRHGRPVSGEAPYVRSIRHRGAAGSARQDHRLRDLRHRQLPPDGRSRSPERGDAGHDLPLQPDLLA